MIKIMEFLLFLSQIFLLALQNTQQDITLTTKDTKLHIMMKIVRQAIYIPTHIKFLQQPQI
jgi:hypothetical protein